MRSDNVLKIPTVFSGVAAAVLLAVTVFPVSAQAAPVSQKKAGAGTAETDVSVMTKAIIRSEEDPGTYLLKYDKDGHILKTILNYDRSNKGYEEKDVYRYVPSGVRTIAVYGPDRRISSTKQYAYENNRILYEYVFNGDARSFTFNSSDRDVSYRSKTAYTYNKKGQVRKKVFLRYGNGSIQRDSWTYKYAYNSAGLKKTQKIYTSAGVLSETSRFAYDANGNYSRIRVYDRDGNLTSTRKYTNTYTPDGSLSETVLTVSSNGEDDINVTMTFRYKKMTVRADEATAAERQQREFLESLQS